MTIYVQNLVSNYLAFTPRQKQFCQQIMKKILNNSKVSSCLIVANTSI